MGGIFGELRPAQSGEPARCVFDALHPFHSYDVGSVVPAGYPAYAALAHREDPDDDQREGEPDERDLLLLAEHLATATKTPERAWFCYWEGWGQFHVSAGAVAALTSTGAPPDDPSWRDPYELIEDLVARAPKVGVPQRQYHLFAGPVRAATDCREPNDWYQAPSLWWPDDQAWIVATEIDFSWTYVGGSLAVIDELLDAWPHPARHAAIDEPSAWP